ncbi:MAG: PocR ligand-binding domain-containing protein [Desulfococcaceae bacterium]
MKNSCFFGKKGIQWILKKMTEFKEKKDTLTSGVDTGLIAMFLKMSPEERVLSNDNAINAIAELRNAGILLQKNCSRQLSGLSSCPKLENEVKKMKYRLADIIDIAELKRVMENFSDATHVVTALLELDGTVLIATGWQDICTKFHRIHTETALRCMESDTALAGRLKNGEMYNVYKCLNGLADAAVPVIIDGEHMGNFFTGQYFCEPPDKEFFRRKAARYGFDEDAYLKALEKVPIFSDDYVKKIMNFLAGLTGMIGNMGLVSKQQSEIDRIQAEMAVAKKIQTCLLPKKTELTGYEIAASCDPAEEVGGDYYDVISVGGYDWIIIGDVSGHGVTSGLVMMMVQTAIHTVLIQNPQVQTSRLLSVINQTIYENIVKMDEQKHMTIIVIACGKDGFFDFSGLHEDILFWCAETRKVENIETDGMWIGLEADISGMLPVNEFHLGTGDCIILYTDGIIEAREKDGRFFGTERLIAVIEASGGKSASEIHAAILNGIRDFEKTDDVTLFVMKRV